MSCDSIEPVALRHAEIQIKIHVINETRVAISLQLKSYAAATNKVICHAEQEVTQKAPV